jgi:hypothetical protein
MDDGKIAKSPECIDGHTSHDIEGGSESDNGMMFFTCCRCFERFYLIAETTIKNSGFLVVKNGQRPAS